MRQSVGFVHFMRILLYYLLLLLNGKFAIFLFCVYVFFLFVQKFHLWLLLLMFYCALQVPKSLLIWPPTFLRRSKFSATLKRLKTLSFQFFSGLLFTSKVSPKSLSLSPSFPFSIFAATHINPCNPVTVADVISSKNPLCPNEIFNTEYSQSAWLIYHIRKTPPVFSPRVSQAQLPAFNNIIKQLGSTRLDSAGYHTPPVR